MASKKTQDVDLDIEIMTDLKHYKNSFINSDKYANFRNIINEFLNEHEQYTEQEVIDIIKTNIND